MLAEVAGPDQRVANKMRPTAVLQGSKVNSLTATRTDSMLIQGHLRKQSP